MGRAIVSVVVGYVTMFVIVFLGLTAAYLVMGADGAFRPGNYDVRTRWIVLSFVVGLIAAIAGGTVCVKIAKRPRPVLVFAGLVFVLGLLMAIPTLQQQPSPAKRTADVGNMDAMMQAQTPPWVAIINPFIGAIGVMIGGRCCGKRETGAPAA